MTFKAQLVTTDGRTYAWELDDFLSAYDALNSKFHATLAAGGSVREARITSGPGGEELRYHLPSGRTE